MVKKAAHFTPEILLGAPRRSAGVANPSATFVLHTTTTYSFEEHSRTIELKVLELSTHKSHVLEAGDEISDPNWLNDDEFVYLQSEKDGTTNVYWNSISQQLKETRLATSHYVVGKIDAPAGDLKIARLTDSEFAVVVSARASPNGSLYNPEKAEAVRSSGRLYDSLYVRHWDRWSTKEKKALWYGTLKKGDEGKYQLSNLTNALKGTQLECPIEPFGGTDNFDISHKGIIFVSKDPDLKPALNTKCNVYLLQIGSWDGGCTPKPEQLEITGYEGAASSPVFSPDGSRAAFLSMKKNGYEADKNRIFLVTEVKVARAQPVIALSSGGGDTFWDRSPQSVKFGADGQSLLAVAEDHGYAKLFSIPFGSSNPTEPSILTNHASVSDVQPLPTGQIFVSGSSLIDNSFYALIAPNGPTSKNGDTHIWFHSISGEGSKFGLHRGQVSSIWTPASNSKVNREVHSWVVKPSNFDKSKKYPVAYLIHGGPQGSWGDSWSTRWNPAVFAEQGYIVISPNPTGSTGYGQAFTDAIRNNWGGDPYQDIVNVFEWVEENMTEVDNERAVALGASYGGYMINWIQGHDLGRKFKALVCHDGITTSAASGLATEELYFPFHDQGGTPWYDPGFKSSGSKSHAASEANRNFGASTFSDWRKWDPSEHFVNWSTPELVIHSEKDYRLCIADGLAAFNVLQARGIESQFLTFPDENHWVLKPENSLVWHKVVLNWINKHVKLPPYTTEESSSAGFWGGIKEDKDETQRGEMLVQGKRES